MNTPLRYMPSWPFPSYIFIPGKNPHPKKSGGHMEGEKDPVAPLIDPQHPEKNDFLRYALDLYNYGYYWEAHVYFEALWNTHGRKGPVADFLKGLIKLSAGGVKVLIDQKKLAEEHFLRARELFVGVKVDSEIFFLGLNLDQIVSEIDLAMDSKELKLILKPEWK